LRRCSWFYAAKVAIKREELSMLSNGTAKYRTLRDTNRAALGCPSITGSWSRPFANDYREHGTQPTR
jgi:hypothetical protein